MNRRIQCAVWEIESLYTDSNQKNNICACRSFIGGHESFWIFIKIEEIYRQFKSDCCGRSPSCYWMVSGIYLVVSQYLVSLIKNATGYLLWIVLFKMRVLLLTGLIRLSDVLYYLTLSNARRFSSSRGVLALDGLRPLSATSVEYLT
jgi:hypothetical protein